jgi:hypothetical protein
MLALLRHLAEASRHPARRAALTLEALEERTVPTLLGNSLFPADNPWNQKITNAPVAANSTAILNNITTLYSNGQLHPDFGQDYHTGTDLYGIPYNVVHGNSTPKVPVVIDAYASESDLQNAPIPAGAVIEGDYQNGPKPGVDARGDSHLLVYDEDNNIAYEFYRASRPGENADGQWHADQETVWNLNTNQFRTLGWTSADAAGLPILPGLVRPDEALPASQGGQGLINHAIRFTLQNNIILNQYLYPASHTANPGNTSAAIEPPMGARFRLKASVDISQLNPESKVIAQAMKDYGLIVADNGSNFYFSGASYAVDASNNIALTFDDNDIQDTLHGLKSLHFSDFEVVDLTPAVTGLSTTSGTAGTSVTISGRNFSGAAGHLQVLFGTTPATGVTVVDDDHVTAAAPAGSGTVDVRVQSGVNAPGNSANVNNPIFGYGISALTAADRFTYTATTPPAAPTNLIATGSNTQVTLTWTASTGATSYNVFRSTSAGGEGTTPWSTGLTTTTFTDTGLTNGTTSFYKVTAVNTAGQSATSNEASATPNLPPITGLSLSGQSVLEFRPVGTVVGTFSTAEAGSGHTFTYSLVSGTGSTDNSSFSISGNHLLSADAFDFAARSSYSIRVRTTDETGQHFEQTFTISITDDPALTRSGQTLTISGTAGNDSFTFTDGAVRYALTLNGVALAADVASVNTLVFVGNGGSDTASLLGSGSSETATLAPGSGQLKGSGYTARVSGVSVLSIQGGPGAVAYFSDSPGNDTFIALPGNSYLSGPGFWEQALGFGAVVAGSSGGSDRATLYGVAGANFLGTPTNSQLSGPGLWEQASGFAVVIASAGPGGNQKATLYGSAGNDTLTGTPSTVSLSGSGYWEQASGYAVVFAVGSGGTDSATLYDSPGDDTFSATPGSSYLSGSGYWNQVYGFGVVIASDSGQGNDRAYLYGSAGNDTFAGTPSSSYLSGSGYWEQTYGFKVVLAVGQGGSDVAQLYDSAGNDTFVGTPTNSYLSGSGFWNQVFGFASVFAVANAGGTDTATLYDSPGNDSFVGQGPVAYLSGAGYLNWTTGFHSVTAVSSSGGSDTADLYTLDYLFAEIGPWLNHQH